MSEPECVVYTNGDKEWYLNGKLHREDGPAVIRSNGTEIWFLNGIKVTREEAEMLMFKDLEELFDI